MQIGLCPFIPSFPLTLDFFSVSIHPLSFALLSTTSFPYLFTPSHPAAPSPVIAQTGCVGGYRRDRWTADRRPPQSRSCSSAQKAGLLGISSLFACGSLWCSSWFRVPLWRRGERISWCSLRSGVAGRRREAVLPQVETRL